MKIKLKFTQEHIDLIKAINFETINFNEIIKNFEQYNTKVLMGNTVGDIKEVCLCEILDKYRINIDSIYGVDTYNLWGGTYLWEQMAYILGLNDKVIKGTEEDPTGPKYPEDVMNYMQDLAVFIFTHLEHIFQILLQFCTEGIQTDVTYWCYDYEKIWKKEKDS